MNKILIIVASDYSSLFLSLILTKAIKQKDSTQLIDYLSPESNLLLLQCVPEIHNIKKQQADFVATTYDLLKEGYSHVIDLQKSCSTFFIKNYLKQQFNSRVVIKSYPYLSKLRTINEKDKINICKQNSAICSAYDFKPYTINIPDELALKKDDLPLSHLAGYECIVLDKKLEGRIEKKVIDLIKNSKLPLILAGDKESFTLAESFQTHNPSKVYNACGKFSLVENYNIFQRSLLNYGGSGEFIALAQNAGPRFISL